MTSYEMRDLEQYLDRENERKKSKERAENFNLARSPPSGNLVIPKRQSGVALPSSFQHKSQLDGWSTSEPSPKTSSPSSYRNQPLGYQQPRPSPASVARTPTTFSKPTIPATGPLSGSTLTFEKIKLPGDDEDLLHAPARGGSLSSLLQPPPAAATSPAEVTPAITTSPAPAPTITTTTAAAPPSQSPAPAAPTEQNQPEQPGGKKEKKEKNKGTMAPPPKDGGEKKQLTKEERRALQEKQRAEKAARLGISADKLSQASVQKKAVPAAPSAAAPTGAPAHSAPSGGSPQPAQDSQQSVVGDGEAPSSKKQAAASKQSVPATVQYDDPKMQAKLAKQQVVQRAQLQKGHHFFTHLPQYERLSGIVMTDVRLRNVHTDIIRVGQQINEGIIRGANARCLAMLEAFKSVIRDYTTPADKHISRDLTDTLKPQIQFLSDCRLLSITMGNAIKWLKMQIHKLPSDMSEREAKEHLLEALDDYIGSKITAAQEIISDHGCNRIVDGDVVLTFARSHVIEQTLKKAHDKGKKFRVIVADCRPHFEGRVLLQHLSDHGVSCTYILINAVSNMMKEVTKVYLGAASMTSGGNLIARAGTAQVAMMGKNYNRPVLVFCETYKFTERVHLDSIGFNELGDPDELIYMDRDDVPDRLAEWREIPQLKLLNLRYDNTPLRFLDIVVSEVGLLPPTSVPVIIREYMKELTL